MYGTRFRSTKTLPWQLTADPAQLAAFIDAWETARASYGEVLRAGVDRSDIELAHDLAYRRLLEAGLQIHRIGGADAVRVVAECLELRMNQTEAHHFRRLWKGLVPGRGH